MEAGGRHVAGEHQIVTLYAACALPWLPRAHAVHAAQRQASAGSTAVARWPNDTDKPGQVTCVNGCTRLRYLCYVRSHGRVHCSAPASNATGFGVPSSVCSEMYAGSCPGGHTERCPFSRSGDGIPCAPCYVYVYHGREARGGHSCAELALALAGSSARVAYAHAAAPGRTYI